MDDAFAGRSVNLFGRGSQRGHCLSIVGTSQRVGHMLYRGANAAFHGLIARLTFQALPMSFLGRWMNGNMWHSSDELTALAQRVNKWLD